MNDVNVESRYCRKSAISAWR